MRRCQGLAALAPCVAPLTPVLAPPSCLQVGRVGVQVQCSAVQAGAAVAVNGHRRRHRRRSRQWAPAASAVSVRVTFKLTPLECSSLTFSMQFIKAHLFDAIH